MRQVCALLAHQGGWDEILLVGGPIVVIIVLLSIAKRRVDAAASELDQDGVSVPDTDDRSDRGARDDTDV